jgi:hypothetical protein
MGEGRLMVFRNRVLKRTEEETGDRRKLDNNEHKGDREKWVL